MSENVSIPATRHWTVPAMGPKGGLRVTLSLPIDPGEREVSLLVLLDGDTMFLTATEFARTVRRVTIGEFPPVAVVGVMRDTPDHLRYVASRFHDFTPQEWELPGPFAPDNSFATYGTGGASGFLAEIENDVLPQAHRMLGVEGMTVKDTAIGGWSLSGLFASWAWLERPHVFDHLLAVSPSLWWGDACILDAPFAPRPAGQRAFVCAGEHEEGDPRFVWPQSFANGEQREIASMVRNAATFAVMANEAGALVDHITFVDEHHVTLQAAAVSRGIRTLFDPAS